MLKMLIRYVNFVADYQNQGTLKFISGDVCQGWFYSSIITMFHISVKYIVKYQIYHAFTAPETNPRTKSLPSPI